MHICSIAWSMRGVSTATKNAWIKGQAQIWQWQQKNNRTRSNKCLPGNLVKIYIHNIASLVKGCKYKCKYNLFTKMAMGGWDRTTTLTKSLDTYKRLKKQRPVNITNCRRDNNYTKSNHVHLVEKNKLLIFPKYVHVHLNTFKYKCIILCTSLYHYDM